MVRHDIQTFRQIKDILVGQDASGRYIPPSYVAPMPQPVVSSVEGMLPLVSFRYYE